MWYSNMGKKNYFSTYPPPTLIHMPIALPLRRNPQHRSLLNCCLSHVCTSVSTSWPLREFLDQVVNRFEPQTFPTVNRKHFFMNRLCIESFCLQKTKHNKTLLFGSTLLKHGRHFDYWNQPLNMSMLVCYLDCEEAGLCCYLLIHTEKPLHPLKMF
jgi:hypothetical protein